MPTWKRVAITAIGAFALGARVPQKRWERLQARR